MVDLAQLLNLVNTHTLWLIGLTVSNIVLLVAFMVWAYVRK